MRKRTAIVTGSFDPVTSGHENLFRRAAEIFDEVYAVIVFNTEKKEGMFSPAERALRMAAAEQSEDMVSSW